MNPVITGLISEGDYYLKEAKSIYFVKKEESYNGSCNSCNAIKKYLNAYEEFLFENKSKTENYHVLLHLICQKDPEFRKFMEKIFEVKCFAEESQREKENFFLFDEEINDVLNSVFEIRSYITAKVGFDKEFLADYFESSMMTT